MSARRSVYFHSSTRRCGSPRVSNWRNAPSRNAATAPLPGRLPRAVAKAALSACSAGVFMARTSAFMASGRLAGKLRIAFGFKLQRKFLAARFDNPALGHHVHHVGHDKIKQALIVRDDHHRALRRTKTVDALGNGLECVDVETGIGLVEHREPWLQNRHL